jgi:Glycosyl-transferase for dystroglycan
VAINGVVTPVLAFTDEHRYKFIHSGKRKTITMGPELTELCKWFFIRMASRRTLAWMLVIVIIQFQMSGFSRFPSLRSIASPRPEIELLPLPISSTVTQPRSIAQNVPAADSNLRERMKVQSAMNETNKAGIGTEQTPTIVLQPPTNHPTIHTGLDNASLIESVSSLSTATTNTDQYNFQRYFDDAPLCLPQLDAAQIGFTLVTQSSLDRLWIMEYQCARWKGPISLAVFVASDDPRYNNSSPTAESIRDDLVQSKNCSANQLSVRLIDGYTAQDFPINFLRNTALTAVQTSHVVFVDVDFWLPRNLNQQLMRHAVELAADHKLIMVLPAFELKDQCSGKTDSCLDANLALMPESKAQLVYLWENTTQISTFLPSYPPAQSSTLYDRWKNQSDDELVPISCLQSNDYEPFTVFRYCRDLPPFQTAFYGYGKDKDAWMQQTRRSGYHYKQTGASYIVHYPHAPSHALRHFKTDFRQKWRNLKRKHDAFVKWLSTFADETVVSLC